MKVDSSRRAMGRHSPALGAFVCVIAALSVAPVLLTGGDAMAQEPELTPLELLGKHFFFDERLSTPRRRQACVSCHSPAAGWVLPDARINQTSVVAPGASPQARGFVKSPSNAYAPRTAFRESPSPFLDYDGGNFWGGRSEGCAEEDCQIGEFATETITPEDVGNLHPEYTEFLGPVADQALNPTSRPGVEQNTRVQVVCNLVRNGPYADLYEAAWSEPINCSPRPKGDPAYQDSFKKLAVALSAWQASPDVNSSSSERDNCIRNGNAPDPFTGCLSDVERQGHDLFYGITSDVNPTGANAFCSLCHNSLGGADRTGIKLENTYADHGFRNIGIPFNREIPTTAKGDIVGLSGHLGSADPTVRPGSFKTPTARNVAKGEGDINNIAEKGLKAFMHNGYFKNLLQVVHFYNTRDAKTACEDLGITDATSEEAIANDCWPAPEFPAGIVRGIVGNLGLTTGEEEALVLYLRTLSDEHTASAP